jgi:hypothetical protein
MMTCQTGGKHQRVNLRLDQLTQAQTLPDALIVDPVAGLLLFKAS